MSRFRGNRGGGGGGGGGGWGRGRGGGGRGGGGRGGRGRGFGGGYGGRGNYGDYGEPEQVTEFGYFTHPCEDQLVVKSTIEQVPFFNAPIYLENKQQVGKVDEILGPIRSYLYIDPAKLLPLQRFLPKPPGGKVQRPRGSGSGRGGGGGRGGRRGGFQRGGFNRGGGGGRGFGRGKGFGGRGFNSR